MTTLHVARAASLWYPIMLAQERGEISESKGAELLGMSLLDYRAQKEIATKAVMRLISDLPSPLTSLVATLRERPELFESIHCASNSNGTAVQNESTSQRATLLGAVGQMYVDCKSESEAMVVNLAGIRVVEIKESPRSSRIVYDDGCTIDVPKRIAQQVAAALVKAA